MSNDGYDTSGQDNSAENQAPPPEHYATTQATPQQTDAENSLPMLLSVWWSFTWRFVVIFVAISFLIGLIVALATGGDVVRTEQIGSFISLFASIPISIWSLGKALSVKHKRHRVIFTRSAN